MSWQRILEVARRRKMPMIVTDVAGREPMVLLPFEQYEELLENEMVFSDDDDTMVDAPMMPSVEEPDLDEAAIDRIAEQSAAEFQKKVAAAAVESEGEPDAEDGLSTEERFYLEPVEDTQK